MRCDLCRGTGKIYTSDEQNQFERSYSLCRNGCPEEIITTLKNGHSIKMSGYGVIYALNSNGVPIVFMVFTKEQHEKLKNNFKKEDIKKMEYFYGKQNMRYAD